MSPLKTLIQDPDQYHVIFLGFPAWDLELPPPMKSFLHQHSFRGKTIIPFNTNGVYGPGRASETVRELCPGSTILQGFSARGGLERDGQLLTIQNARVKEVQLAVGKWLKTLGTLHTSTQQ